MSNKQNALAIKWAALRDGFAGVWAKAVGKFPAWRGLLALLFGLVALGAVLWILGSVLAGELGGNRDLIATKPAASTPATPVPAGPTYTANPWPEPAPAQPQATRTAPRPPAAPAPVPEATTATAPPATRPWGTTDLDRAIADFTPPTTFGAHP